MSQQVKVDELVIEGVTYVPKENVKKVDLSNIVLVRTYSAGVHFGAVKERDRANQVIILENAKRLHQWSGACSLSQVAIDGVDLNNSRISLSVPEIELARVIEIIPMSEKAAKQLIEAKEWKK